MPVPNLHVCSHLKGTIPMTIPHPFNTLLPKQAVPLRRRALKLTSNSHLAEDLVQATLLKAWASRNSFCPDTNLRAWLFTILRNTFFSELRKYRLEVRDIDDHHAQSQFVEPVQDHVLALKELNQAISLLPHDQQRPLVLMGVYGYSQLEVADACGCTLGTIKSRVSRGRAALARMLEHDPVLPPVAQSSNPTQRSMLHFLPPEYRATRSDSTNAI